MRTPTQRSRTRRTIATVLALGLLATACGNGDDNGTTIDGPTITVASFGFSESEMLAEMYAQALEANGYDVARNLNLGAREVLFPELESGAINLLPEYVSSALQVGFGGEPTSDVDTTLVDLRERFAEIDVTVLTPAPGENKNVFVVTQEFADANDLTRVSDLATLDSVTFTGPPECEDRQTCYAGLVDVYGLDNIMFESELEGSTRIENLVQGNVDMTLLFSAQPVITARGLVVLEEDMTPIAAENIVPVVTDDIIEAYGDDLAALLDSVSALITTDVLLELNGKVEIDAESPRDVARDFLAANGLI
jgi:osmoprotectant transport system substrate-binding protein